MVGLEHREPSCSLVFLPPSLPKRLEVSRSLPEPVHSDITLCNWSGKLICVFFAGILPLSEFILLPNLQTFVSCGA